MAVEEFSVPMYTGRGRGERSDGGERGGGGEKRGGGERGGEGRVLSPHVHWEGEG